MAGAATSGIRVRVYQRADRPQIESFRCAPYGEKWCETAEKIIRESPGAIASGEYYAVIAVAEDGGVIVGVVVFGFETEKSASEVTIFSLGVVLARQRQGIGTRLKQAVMAAAADDSGVVAVVSRVHRANRRMLGLNEKLNVGTTKDPDDGEFLLTAIVVEPDIA